MMSTYNMEETYFDEDWDSLLRAHPDTLKTASKPRINPLMLDTLMAKVDAAGPRHWAIEGIWIEGTPLVIGAEAKVGKSMALIDLMVSLASGTPWLNTFDVAAPGGVLAFFVEDDEFEVVRRLRAVCANRGIDPQTLPISLEFLAPNLSDEKSLAEVEKHLVARREAGMDVKYLILDPLYLSAGADADSANLIKMGTLLNRLKELCYKYRVAPVVCTHWNKTGKGHGTDRFTGSGTKEWARTLISMWSSGKTKEYVDFELPDGTVVVQERETSTLNFEFSGNSIQESTVSLRRTMWSEIPKDLNCPLFYVIDVIDEVAEVTSGAVSPFKASARAVRAIEHLDGWFTKHTVQHWDADNRPVFGDGTPANPIRTNTFSVELKKLRKAGVLISHTEGQTNYYAKPGTPEFKPGDVAPF